MIMGPDEARIGDADRRFDAADRREQTQSGQGTPERRETQGRTAPKDETQKPSGEQTGREGPEEKQPGREAPVEKPDGRVRRKRGFWQTVKSHKLAFALGTIVLIAAIVGATLWWLQARHYESTDDAFVDARPVAISSLVSGMIVDVPVTDNQLVQAGTVLARIDDRDYRAAVDQAQAQVDEGRAAIASAEAQIEAQQAVVDQTRKQEEEAQAALTFSKQQNARYQDLV
jgi:membrane fusion protein (multidrug efflux system)